MEIEILLVTHLKLFLCGYFVTQCTKLRIWFFIGKRKWVNLEEFLENMTFDWFSCKKDDFPRKRWLLKKVDMIWQASKEDDDHIKKMPSGSINYGVQNYLKSTLTI